MRGGRIVVDLLSLIGLFLHHGLDLGRGLGLGLEVRRCLPSMRYIRLKTSIARLVDDNIDDPEVVRAILQQLKDKELTCSIRLGNGPIMPSVRITGVDDNGISIRIFQKGSSLIKNAGYNEIDYLEVNTQDEIMLKNKEKVTRWTLLDPAGEWDVGA